MSAIGNKEIFAKNLSYYLKRSGKEQKEIAEFMGVATSTFNDWVKGKKYPRIDKIEMLANYFHILKSDLIEERIEDISKAPTESIRLSEGEKTLLTLFRKIPQEKQSVVLEMISLALKTQG